MLSRKLVLLILGAVLLSSATWPTYWVWTQLRPYESNAIADSSWTPGGQPYRITFRVVDVAGSPLPGIGVTLVDPSGGDSGTTDANGEWVYHPDGGLLTFRLNGVSVMKERELLLAPEAGKNGWKLQVVVKDLAAIGANKR